MIIVKLISGLGNQLFQYAVGRELSLKRKVPLKLDTFYYKNDNGRSYKLDNFNINAEIATEKEIEKITAVYSSSTICAKIYRRAEKLIPRHKRKYFRESGLWMYEPNLLNARSNVYLDGYWQHYKYFVHTNPLILSELAVIYNYTYAEQAILRQIKSEIASVSVHIRRGDYLFNPETNNFLGVLPISYYTKSFECIKQRITNPVFYIFSDDQEWAKNNIHIGSPTVFVEGSRDFIDLELMSNCKHNIIANSSFSWWGAFLNRNPEKIVIAPRKWVSRDDLNEEIQIQLPSWIKL